MSEIVPTLTLHPGELTAHPANSNTHNRANIEELAESRRLFDQYKNCVVWSPAEEIAVEIDGQPVTLKPGIKYVIAGNGFHQASLLRQDDAIEVKDYSHLSYAEALLLMETDNASPLGSKPDPVRMKENLERAKGLIADNPRMVAMMDRARELAGVVNGNGKSGEEPSEVTPTEAERLAEVYGTRLGQVWELGRHKIACVDSTDEETVKGLVGSDVVGMVWADPPYGISTVGNDGAVGYSLYPKGVYGQLADKNTYAPVVGDDSPKTALRSFSICSNADKAIQIWWGGNYYADKLPKSNCWLIWDKQTDGNEFADCEIAWTNLTGRPRMFRHAWNGMIKASEHGQKRVHPTQKPMALAHWCFEKYGHPNDLVFDPFLGSGISVLAAEQLDDGRQVIGCELAPEYIAVTIQRWADLTGREPKLLTS